MCERKLNLLSLGTSTTSGCEAFLCNHVVFSLQLDADEFPFKGLARDPAAARTHHKVEARVALVAKILQKVFEEGLRLFRYG